METEIAIKKLRNILKDSLEKCLLAIQMDDWDSCDEERIFGYTRAEYWEIIKNYLQQAQYIYQHLKKFKNAEIELKASVPAKYLQ